jgi:uncharacterized membrane protein
VGREASGQRGQALVEAALLLPILLIVTLGAIDFGRLYFAHTAIANAAREGAMCASYNGFCPGGASGAAEAEVGGALAGGIATDVASDGETVTVTVTYTFESATAAILGQRSFPISARATMVIQ